MKPTKVMFYTKENKKVFFKATESGNKRRYDYLGFEEKVAQEFKKKKPTGMTNTEWLETLLDKVVV